MREWSPDWFEEARRKLANSQLTDAEREEISRELAGYLEDLCADAAARGLDDSSAGQIDATQTAAAELHEDKHLGAHLYRALKENAMYLNDRTKRFWLPSISVLLASAVLLVVFQFFALGLYHAVAPAPIVGSLSMYAKTYPELINNLLRRNGAALLIYLGWLCTLPFLGALGANWSRRAGSSRPLQIATALFPLVLFLAIFVGQQDVGQRGTSLSFLAMGALPPAHIFFMFLTVSANLLLNWVIIPGAVLLVGVLPFLLANGGSRQQASAATPVGQMLVAKRT